MLAVKRDVSVFWGFLVPVSVTRRTYATYKLLLAKQSCMIPLKMYNFCKLFNFLFHLFLLFYFPLFISVQL